MLISEELYTAQSWQHLPGEFLIFLNFQKLIFVASKHKVYFILPESFFLILFVK